MKEPNYIALQAISKQAEKEAPLSVARYRKLMSLAEQAAGDQPQLVEFMCAFIPDELTKGEE